MSAFYLKAQDIIIDKQGNRLSVKVIRILPETVEYKKEEIPDGPLYVVRKCDIVEIIFPNGQKEIYKEECEDQSSNEEKKVVFGRFSPSFEIQFGTFGLFNVDDSLTKAEFSFGATPSFMVRLHKYIAVGAECMLLWGQVRTDDPIRFIINLNLRGEFIFPLSSKFSLELIVATGLSIWPVHDMVGILDATFFHQRSGWDARASFGAEWCFNPSMILMCNVGYSASSSVSEEVWITHDMMLISFSVRYSFKPTEFRE